MLISLVHLSAASAFIGGIFYHLAVVRPAFRRPLPVETAAVLRRVDGGFRTLRWASLLTLLGTGIVHLVEVGDSPRLTSSYGGVLLVKLLLVLIVFSLNGLYDFLRSGRRRITAEAKESESHPGDAMDRWIGGTILLAGLAVLYAALAMEGL